MASIIIAQNVSQEIAGKSLFSDLTLGVEEKEKIAILGANGSGKSTLLKLFADFEHAQSGQIIPRRDLKIAYVAQQDEFANLITVEEVLRSELNPDDRELDRKLSQYLGVFQFANRKQKVSELSGGWRKRLSLARGFIQEADLLLLDEPTNHLDIASIEWLEDKLKELNSTVIFVSHDRVFIDSLASRVVELDLRYPNGVLSCIGGYADFLDHRENYLSQRQKNYEVLTNKVRREVAWLRQGAKARTTKSKHRTDEALNLIDDLKSFKLDNQSTQFNFSSTDRKSKELLKAEGISKSIAGKALFENFSIVLSPGMRLGVAGDNGSGKSTLLNTLVKKIPSDTGSVIHAPNCRISFFEQNRDSLDPKLTLQEALMGDAKSIVVSGKEYVAAAWARKFLFNVNQLSTAVSKLSGGELARVMIARIIRDPCDILILDEPTNDLDIQTLEVLEQSIAEFSGAVILVTHDRYLLDRLSTSIAGILGNGRIELFASYLQWEIAKEASAKTKVAFASSRTNSEELDKLTDKIERAEKQLIQIQDQLAQVDPLSETDKFNKLCNNLSDVQERIDLLYKKWEELEQS